MAQTVYTASAPNTDNAVINTLPLVMWSDNRAEPQFKYVVDVYYASDPLNRLTRVKVASNASFNNGAGVLDLAPIIRDYLDYDLDKWTTAGRAWTNENNARRFKVELGEEYASSSSGSAVLYNGVGFPGGPSVDGGFYNLYLAVHELDQGSYNWDIENHISGSWLTNQTHTSSALPKIVYDGDYETISFVDNLYATFGGDIASVVNTVKASVYNNGTLKHSGTVGSAISPTPFTKILGYVGVGPQNLMDYDASFSSSLSSSWTDIEIDITASDGAASPTYFYQKYYFKNGDCTNYDRTRFAFINKFGTWDYFNVDLPLSKQTKLERKTTKRTHLQYQDFYANLFGGVPTLLGGPIYKEGSTGLDQYYIQPTDEYNITTNWLDNGQADWLTEMIDSPNVYTQIGSSFQPINITSADYQWKTNPRGQKVFQFNIKYQLSNKRSSR